MRDGRGLVVLAGSGLSSLAGIPDASRAAEGLLGVSRRALPDWPRAVQDLPSSLRRVLVRRCLDFARDPDADRNARVGPSREHQLLVDLVSAGFVDLLWTTNFDHLLEDACSDASLPVASVDPLGWEACRLLTLDRVPVVHLHGRDGLSGPEAIGSTQRGQIHEMVRGATASRDLIVLGWSGACDPLVDLLPRGLAPGARAWRIDLRHGVPLQDWLAALHELLVGECVEAPDPTRVEPSPQGSEDPNSVIVPGGPSTSGVRQAFGPTIGSAAAWAGGLPSFLDLRAAEVPASAVVPLPAPQLSSVGEDLQSRLNVAPEDFGPTRVDASGQRESDLVTLPVEPAAGRLSTPASLTECDQRLAVDPEDHEARQVRARFRYERALVAEDEAERSRWITLVQQDWAVLLGTSPDRADATGGAPSEAWVAALHESLVRCADEAQDTRAPAQEDTGQQDTVQPGAAQAATAHEGTAHEDTAQGATEQRDTGQGATPESKRGDAAESLPVLVEGVVHDPHRLSVESGSETVASAGREPVALSSWDTGNTTRTGIEPECADLGGGARSLGATSSQSRTPTFADASDYDDDASDLVAFPSEPESDASRIPETLAECDQRLALDPSDLEARQVRARLRYERALQTDDEIERSRWIDRAEQDWAALPASRSQVLEEVERRREWILYEQDPQRITASLAHCLALLRPLVIADPRDIELGLLRQRVAFEGVHWIDDDDQRDRALREALQVLERTEAGASGRDIQRVEGHGHVLADAARDAHSGELKRRFLSGGARRLGEVARFRPESGCAMRAARCWRSLALMTPDPQEREAAMRASEDALQLAIEAEGVATAEPCRRALQRMRSDLQLIGSEAWPIEPNDKSKPLRWSKRVSRSLGDSEADPLLTRARLQRIEASWAGEEQRAYDLLYDAHCCIEALPRRRHDEPEVEEERARILMAFAWILEGEADRIVALRAAERSLYAIVQDWSDDAEIWYALATISGRRGQVVECIERAMTWMSKRCCFGIPNLDRIRDDASFDPVRRAPEFVRAISASHRRVASAH